jgi:hypothetical protein
MYIQFVKFASRLPEDQVRRLLEERAPQYREVPGLAQKYYIQGARYRRLWGRLSLGERSIVEGFPG